MERVGQGISYQLGLHPLNLARLSSITILMMKSGCLNDQLNHLEDYCLQMNVTIYFLYVLGRDGTCGAEFCLQTRLASVDFSSFESYC
jgi:hypothetical protein